MELELQHVYPTFYIHLMGQEIRGRTFFARLQARLISLFIKKVRHLHVCILFRNTLGPTNLCTLVTPTSSSTSKLSSASSTSTLGSASTSISSQPNFAPSSDNHIGAIVGGVIGGIAIISLAVCLVVFLLVKNKKQEMQSRLQASQQGQTHQLEFPTAVSGPSAHYPSGFKQQEWIPATHFQPVQSQIIAPVGYAELPAER
jgi:hypothetical protein